MVCSSRLRYGLVRYRYFTSSSETCTFPLLDPIAVLMPPRAGRVYSGVSVGNAGVFVAASVHVQKRECVRVEVAGTQACRQRQAHWAEVPSAGEPGYFLCIGPQSDEILFLGGSTGQLRGRWYLRDRSRHERTWW